MYIPLQLSCLHNGGGCYQRFERFQDGSGAVMGLSRREGTRYQEGAKPEDGRGSRPRTPAPLHDPRAREGRTPGADLRLRELVE